MRSSAHPERIGIIQPGVAAGTRPTPLPWVRLIHFPTLKELNLIRFKVQLASAPALSETSAKVDQLGPDKPEACDNRSRWLSARSARYHRNRIKNHLPWRGNTSVLPLTGVDKRENRNPVVSSLRAGTHRLGLCHSSRMPETRIKRLSQRSRVVRTTGKRHRRTECDGYQAIT